MNYQKRIAQLREKLNEIDADAILIEKRENYRYMSGFTGTFAYLIITQKEALILTDSRYTEQATTQAPDYMLIDFLGTSPLENVLNNYSIKKLAIEGDTVTLNKFKEYNKYKSLTEVIATSGVVESLRKVKDEEEISIITKAVEIADKAFDYILGYIKPGITEKEIEIELEYFMKKIGASAASFDIIIATGARTSMPHAITGDNVIKNGDPVLMDFGCIYQGYCSDITRTVFVGNPSDEMGKIYDAVLQVQKAGVENAVDGRCASDVHMCVSNMIDNAGYKGRFGHGLGHGVGLEVHELPRVSCFGSEILMNNMVVTVEPGIYVPGVGGVRIEDIVVIRGEMPSVLTEARKEKIIL